MLLFRGRGRYRLRCGPLLDCRQRAYCRGSSGDHRRRSAQHVGHSVCRRQAYAPARFDLLHALATELNLNIVWAKYNTGAITGAGGSVAWVPFRFDAFLEVLKNRTAISLSDDVWDTSSRPSTECMPSMRIARPLYSLSGPNSDPLPDLRRAMSRLLAGQLFTTSFLCSPATCPTSRWLDAIMEQNSTTIRSPVYGTSGG